MISKKEIRIRDPFVLLDNDTYYVYGTTDLKKNSLDAFDTFSMYKSKDLEYFEGPYVIFNGKEVNFWADRDYWAPEVYKYQGKYYLFASFSNGSNRACQILVSDSPIGKFVPLTNEPITPKDWKCLDGTLFIDRDKPYIIFSREWTEVGDGEIYALKLSLDLTKAIGEPRLLFKASDNKDVTPIKVGNLKGYVTDGPFLFKEDKMIKMIWSSYYHHRYVVLEATASHLDDKWQHHPSRFDFDGGHAMIFVTKNNKRYFALHSPNTAGKERMIFIPYHKEER